MKYDIIMNPLQLILSLLLVSVSFIKPTTVYAVVTTPEKGLVIEKERVQKKNLGFIKKIKLLHKIQKKYRKFKKQLRKQNQERKKIMDNNAFSTGFILLLSAFILILLSFLAIILLLGNPILDIFFILFISFGIFLGILLGFIGLLLIVIGLFQYY